MTASNNIDAVIHIHPGLTGLLPLRRTYGSFPPYPGLTGLQSFTVWCIAVKY